MKRTSVSQPQHQDQHKPPDSTYAPCRGDSLPDAAVERRSAYGQVSRQKGRHSLVANLAPVRHQTAQGVQPTVRRGVVNGGSVASPHDVCIYYKKTQQPE